MCLGVAFCMILVYLGTILASNLFIQKLYSCDLIFVYIFVDGISERLYGMELNF